jgi:hypothetical protein
VNALGAVGVAHWGSQGSFSWKAGRPMSEPSSVAVHEFAQLLAGRVPDERLAAVRRTLADGQAAAAVAAAVALATEHEVPLLAESIETARSLTGDPGALDPVRPAAGYPRLPFRFSELDPDQQFEADDLDLVMAEAAQARRAQIAGVWRAWRYPLDDDEPAAGSAAADPGDLARPHRVYVVQIPDGAAAPVLAGELQAALDGHGDAGVELVGLDSTPPPYQAAALAASALLWSAQDEELSFTDGPPFRIARVFDFARPDTGPGFDPGHRVVTDPAERERLLEYLTSGTLVLHTTARTQDVLNPAAGQVVPGSFRTDGEWIWTDAVAYYLQQHDLAPDEELAAHIDARWQDGDLDAETDAETAVEAANFLLDPPAEQARQAPAR